MVQRHADFQPGVVVLVIDVGHQAPGFAQVDAHRRLVGHEWVVDRRRGHAPGLGLAARHAHEAGFLGHGLEHLQGFFDLGLGDDGQVAGPHGIEAAEEIHPLVGLARVRVDMVGHELLAFAQHFQAVPRAPQVLEPGAGSLAPAFGRCPVGEQNLGGEAHTLARRAEVFLAPGHEPRSQRAVRGIHVDGGHRLRALPAQHADAMVRVAGQVSGAEARGLPVVQRGPLVARLDWDDEVAVAQQGAAMCLKIGTQVVVSPVRSNRPRRRTRPRRLPVGCVKCPHRRPRARCR